MGGISRVHGALLAPKVVAGVAVADFNLTFWSGDVQAGGSSGLASDYNAGAGTPGGAFDQVFRTAVSGFASLNRVGTLSTATRVIRFAIETLGVDADSPGYLGTGNDNAGTNGDGATTALALQARIQALGTVTNSNGAVVHLSSATVTAFTY